MCKIKYGYIKSRYSTQYVSEQMSNRRMKTAKYENRALKNRLNKPNKHNLLNYSKEISEIVW